MSQVSKSTIPTTGNGQISAPSSELAPKAKTKGTSLLEHPTQSPPDKDLVDTSAQDVKDVVPTENPPIQLAEGSQTFAAAGWQTDTKVLGLWSICSDQRNAYMYAEGLGWKKFADNSDSAIMAFNIIAAHAKATGKGANFYEGDDGKINTLYVW